jgi:hypothetical protein
MHAMEQKILPGSTDRPQIRKLGKQPLQAFLTKASGNSGLGFFPQRESFSQGLLAPSSQPHLSFPAVLSRLDAKEPLLL